MAKRKNKSLTITEFQTVIETQEELGEGISPEIWKKLRPLIDNLKNNPSQTNEKALKGEIKDLNDSVEELKQQISSMEDVVRDVMNFVYTSNGGNLNSNNHQQNLKPQPQPKQNNPGWEIETPPEALQNDISEEEIKKKIAERESGKPAEKTSLPNNDGSSSFL